MIAKAEQITNINKQVGEIYALLDELGINYKKTNCSRCRRDLLNIVKEELGLIESAAEVSDFNDCKYQYIHHRTVLWQGHKMNQHTPTEIIEQFIAAGGRGFYVPVG